MEDENKFIFCNVLVGHQAKARFKISNVGKISCDINIIVKPISNKVGGSVALALYGWYKAREGARKKEKALSKLCWESMWFKTTHRIVTG